MAEEEHLTGWSGGTSLLATWGRHLAAIGLLAAVEIGLLHCVERASRASHTAEARAVAWIPGSAWSMDSREQWAAARVLMRTELHQPTELAGIALVNVNQDDCFRISCQVENPVAVALSPDASWLVVAAAGQPLKILHQPWAKHSTIEWGHLEIPETWVDRLAFSPSGKYLAVVGERSTLVVDWATRSILWSAERAEDAPQLLRFSADSQQLAGVDDLGRFAVWQVASGDLVSQGSPPAGKLLDAWWSDRLQAWVVFAQQNSQLVAHTGTPEGALRPVWHCEGRYRQLALAGNGQSLAITDSSGSLADNCVRVLDLLTGEERTQLPAPRSLSGMALTTGGELYCWDRAGEIHRHRPGPTSVWQEGGTIDLQLAWD